MRRLFVLLTAGLLAASLAVPAAVSAAGSTYQVPRPNGHDDTTAIQTGLDWCTAHGPGCTVQLQAGTYRTSQLVEYGFRGTFKGVGQHRTTIRALPHLLITGPDPWVDGACLPNLTDCRAADFIIFVNGNVRVSDLALDFPATNGTETTPFTLGGNQYSGLMTALEFTGDTHAHAAVDHVSVTGRADHTASNLLGLGFNVAQGIMFDGWYPSAPFPSFTSATRSGTFTVRNSTVRTFWDAVLVNGAIRDSKITISGNRISDVDFGLDLSGANSVFEISNNRIAATNAAPEEIDHVGVLVEPTSSAGLSTRLSRFSIHDNAFRVSDTCGCGMFGMWLQDAAWGAPDHWFKATIKHNSISLPTTFTLAGEGKEGIDANNITGTVIAANRFTGTAAGTWDAISLWGNDASMLPSTGNVIVGNNVSGLKPAGSEPYPDDVPGLGLSQIYLDAYTTDNRVVCTRRNDTAYDGGTGNTVIGCTTPPLPAAAAPNVSPMLRQASPASRLQKAQLHR